ncbi:hypothetical protein [Clostridium sp. AM58-1XD]|uniref:hypothetical protein n=1 Tax=Clostridium sp. AM58-1XD TaxID=2292307 RepID=UPI000E4972DD|nr:hypothetical protein [Clostridium sp. AM58-1XD]RGY99392.1 hypothetical protein DXA13_07680 [Clostridium sp. AM58-1XD]
MAGLFGIGRDTVYIGQSAEEMERIRRILEQNHIPYQYDVSDPTARFLGPGRGTTRGMGSAGLDLGRAKRYEVTVKRSDAEKARFLIKNESGPS